MTRLSLFYMENIKNDSTLKKSAVKTDRPVSLAKTFSRIFENVLFLFIYKHFLTIRANTQISIINNSLTIAILIESTEMVNQNLNKFKEYSSIYFYFSKAFD